MEAALRRRREVAELSQEELELTDTDERLNLHYSDALARRERIGAERAELGSFFISKFSAF